MSSQSETCLCRFCLADLWHEHTYIKCATVVCAELDVNICLQCFASGAGDAVHKNTDPYRVLSNAVDVGNHMWLAYEEIILLDTFMDTMSWEKVAQKLDRSPKECERHYFEHFVLYPKIAGLECKNKKAFRHDKFNNDIHDEKTTIYDTFNSEGKYFFLLTPILA